MLVVGMVVIIRGNAQATTETFTHSHKKDTVKFPLDKLDTIDDGETVLAHPWRPEFIRTKSCPEFDTYRFRKISWLYK